MNPIIKEHFDIFETRLIESPVIVSYQILRREIAASDGKIRVKATLSDGGNIELFEYVTESKGNIRFGKREFQNIVTVNFEEQPELSRCFSNFDPKGIIDQLSILTRMTITPGQTLLFLDEVQECQS